MRSKLLIVFGLLVALGLPAFAVPAGASGQERDLPLLERPAPTPLAPELTEAFHLLEESDIIEIDDKIDAATSKARRSLDEHEKSLGSDDPLVGESLLTLGLLYTVDLEFAKAEKALKRARAIYEKFFGPEGLPLSYVLTASARWELEKGIDDQAEAWLKRSLTIREKALGSDDLLVARSVFDLAEYYQSKRDFKAAGPLYERALTMRANLLPPGDVLIGQVQSRQACILRKNDKYQEAAELEYLAGVGRKPEYEQGGKYKHPTRYPLDGKIRRRGRAIFPPLVNSQQTWELIGISLSIGPNGKTLYACSDGIAGTQNLSFMIERVVYRTAFKPTFNDGIPVMVDGFIRLFSTGSTMPVPRNPFDPGQ